MSQGRFPGPRSGTCPSCLKTVCRLTKDGLLYNHGPRSGPCPGTGRRPTFVSSQPTPATLRPRLPQVSPQALGQGRLTRTGTTGVDYFSQQLPSVQSSLVPTSSQQLSLSAVPHTLSIAAPGQPTIATDSQQHTTSLSGLLASATTTSYVCQLRPGDTPSLSQQAGVQPHSSSAGPSAQQDSVAEHPVADAEHHQRSMDPGVGVGDGYVEAIRELFCKPKSALIKWIPKSARQSCATLLTKLLAAVVENPQSTEKWINLLLFGPFVLIAPQSSGHSKGVSSQITARCQEFTTTSLQGKLDKLCRETAKQEHGMARKHRTQSDEENLAHRVSRKLEEGNFSGAVKLITSSDTLVNASQAITATLNSKHPSAPGDRRSYPNVNSAVACASVDVPQVFKAIMSFPAGSAGGSCGLTPQHLKDLVRVDGPTGTLAQTLTNFVNVALSGAIPQNVKPLIFGARLLAFQKKDGGIRPIAIGLTLRRLIAKCLCQRVMPKFQALAGPLQLGVGTPRGLEAGVHAAREYLRELAPSHALVKIDFTNAFNSLRRDTLLEAVFLEFPEAYPFLFACYGQESDLYFGQKILVSAEGVQQGDPLGPWLFSLATLPILKQGGGRHAQLKFAYLDDITIGGELQSLADGVEQIRHEAAAMGLAMNDSKSELICCSTINIPSELSGFKRVSADDANLLGVPLSTGSALTYALEKHVECLSQLSPKLALLQSQDTLFILRHSLSTPSIQHVLRGIFCGEHHLLRDLDMVLKTLLTESLNTQFDDVSWQQVTLPVNSGGLGIRSATDLAASAFLASVRGAHSLVTEILSSVVQSTPDPLEEKAVVLWLRQTESAGPPIPDGSPAKMKSWDRPVVTAKFNALLAAASDDYSKARLRAVSSAHAGDWLKAIPAAALGLRLDNESFRVAVGFRLGSRLCSHFTCSCGYHMDPRGAHSLACRKCAGRQSRHATVNEVVAKSFIRAGVPVVKEPSGLIPSSSLRPDGTTVIPWARGRCLAWDVTCPDTVADSYVTASAASAGTAAENAATAKIQKYHQLSATHTFVPLVFETFGTLSDVTLSVLSDLGGRIISRTGDPRERMFMFQRLSMAVQRGNVTCFLNSVQSSQGLNGVE